MNPGDGARTPGGLGATVGARACDPLAMHDNARIIERFYAAFAARDGDGMAACYRDDVTFTDPVFQNLSGDRAKSMWRMLTARAADLTVEVSGIDADDATGRAHWEAHYTFSATGRRVHNVIDATFGFQAGAIKTHTDSFDLWRWSRMAIGPVGVLLGWSPWIQRAIRKKAIAGLDAWMKAHP
ncbi:MAG: nuclear transport factor 2 family protein [Polyangiales bacterium]